MRPGSWLSLAVAVLTSAGLIVVAHRSLRTGAVVERALADGLGPRWRSEIDPVLAGAAAPAPAVGADPVRSVDVRATRRRTLWRTSPTATTARATCSTSTATAPTPRARRRSSTCTEVGSDRGRKNREARPLLYHLASQGWTCISANYHLAAPADAFPHNLIDVKKIIAWVHAHGHELRRRSRHHLPRRRLGRRPPHGDRRAHRQRPDLPTRLRGRRHLDHRRHRTVRLLRPARGDDQVDRTTPLAYGGEASTVLRRPRRPRHLHAARGRPSPRRAPPCGVVPTRFCTPSFPAPSTPSTSSTRCASRPSSTASRRSPRGSAAVTACRARWARADDRSDSGFVRSSGTERDSVEGGGRRGREEGSSGGRGRRATDVDARGRPSVGRRPRLHRRRRAVPGGDGVRAAGRHVRQRHGQPDRRPRLVRPGPAPGRGRAAVPRAGLGGGGRDGLRRRRPGRAAGRPPSWRSTGPAGSATSTSRPRRSPTAGWPTCRPAGSPRGWRCSTRRWRWPAGRPTTPARPPSRCARSSPPATSPPTSSGPGRGPTCSASAG